MSQVFYYLIFPGFLFTSLLGIFASWFDRKLTARLQWRVGPPFLQPLYDLLKLLGKEVILPRSTSLWTFLLFPLIGLSVAFLATNIIWFSFLFPAQGFVGDIVVVIYLLTIPATALIIAAFASANPLASVGASREIKLVLSYELPFLLSALVPLIKAHTLKLGGFIEYQVNNGFIIGSFSGAVAFIVALLCTQAKLGLAPFDIAEAETEIMAGVYIEFSGPVLAVFKLTKFVLLVAAPLLLVNLFWGSPVVGVTSFLALLVKYLSVVLLTVLIRNTNPRLRIDQAMRFFWGKATILAIIAVILAIRGY